MRRLALTVVAALVLPPGPATALQEEVMIGFGQLARQATDTAGPADVPEWAREADVHVPPGSFSDAGPGAEMERSVQGGADDDLVPPGEAVADAVPGAGGDSAGPVSLATKAASYRPHVPVDSAAVSPGTDGAVPPPDAGAARADAAGETVGAALPTAPLGDLGIADASLALLSATAGSDGTDTAGNLDVAANAGLELSTGIAGDHSGANAGAAPPASTTGSLATPGTLGDSAGAGTSDPAAPDAAGARSAGGLGLEEAEVNENDTESNQNRLREVARHRAQKAKESQRSAHMWPIGDVGVSVDRHLALVVVVALIFTCMVVMTACAIGTCNPIERLGSGPKRFSALEHLSQGHMGGMVLRAGISPVRSALAPPWPHRQQRLSKRISFDPRTEGLPSAESLVGTLNAAPAAGVLQAQAVTQFPPPQRLREASPTMRSFGSSVDMFVADEAEPEGGLDMGAFGGTWGRLAPPVHGGRPPAA